MKQVKDYRDGRVICEGATARKVCGRAVHERVSLAFADLRSADLRSADLRSADLRSADLRSAVLRSADLRSADLAGADLAGADLAGADLRSADLRSAVLRSAVLRSANLAGAKLTDATMPDGRTWEAYRLDPLAGICHTPEARERARAASGHTWADCPMHAGNGYNRVEDAPEAERVAVAAFVAVYDAGLLGEEWRTA